MKRLPYIICFFLLIASPVWAGEEISLSLDDALAIGLRENRDLLLQTEEVKKAQAKLSEARAGRLPTVTFTGGVNDTLGYYAEDSTQETTQATVKQILYQGGKISSKIQANRYNLQAAEAALERTQAETILAIKKGFFTLLLAEQYAALNQSIFENTREHLAMLKARYEKGLASQSDLLEVEASLESVRQAHEASQTQLVASQNLLSSLLFLDNDVIVKPATQMAYEPQTVAYDEAFEKALALRPELKEYEAKVRSSQKSITTAKADGRPTISAAWDYYSRSHLTGTTTKNWNDYNVVGLTFSWPIFDGWATKAKVDQAITDLKAAKINQEQGIRDLAVDFKNAYLEFQNTFALVDAAQAEVKVQEDSFTTAESKYKAGLVSSLDFQDVSLARQVSQFKYQEALYDHTVAKARLDKAIGENP